MNSFLASLPILPINELPEDCRCCGICQEDYLTGSTPENSLRLPCQHVFGNSCLSTWLSPDEEKPKKTCPMCRAVLFETEEDTQLKRYLDNMTILYRVMNEKMERKGEDAESLGLEEEASNLAELIVGVPEAPSHPRFLKEIAEFWRKTAGTSEARLYEDIWTFVAGRVLRQE
ncbi:hypothetical protein P7C71_g1981, partial [Lecanoromycetidae sp. Uapishka_2]